MPFTDITRGQVRARVVAAMATVAGLHRNAIVFNPEMGGGEQEDDAWVEDIAWRPTRQIAGGQPSANATQGEWMVRVRIRVKVDNASANSRDRLDTYYDSTWKALLATAPTPTVPAEWYSVGEADADLIDPDLMEQSVLVRVVAIRTHA